MIIDCGGGGGGGQGGGGFAAGYGGGGGGGGGYASGVIPVTAGNGVHACTRATGATAGAPAADRAVAGGLLRGHRG